MAIPEDIILDIKDRNDIESVISPYVTLKRAGKNLKGLCPFHNEKTPSFVVYPENGSFYCFGCGVGGDIFTFTKLIENLDYVEAIKLLAERSGVTIPEDNYDNSMANLKKRVYEINKEAARFYFNNLSLPEGKWALDYLVGRGLTAETIKHFGLGCALDTWTSLLDYMKSKGFKEWELEQANVIAKSQRTGRYYDVFRDRVMFPIIDLRGNIIGFSGRAKPGSEDGRKYINTTDTPVYKKSRNLFGINFAKNSCADRAILVEGNMDVVSLHQSGFTNTVAPCGTAFSEEQARLLARYTKEIVVTLDSDSAGQKAVMRALETMKDLGLPIRVLVLPECKDPDEYIKKNGASRFKLLLDGAVSELDYRLLRAAENINIEEDSARITYLKKAAEILATVDQITADLYAGKLSEKYGVSKTTILTEISRVREVNFKTARKKEFNDIITPKFSSKDLNPERRHHIKAEAAERNLISVLLQHQDKFKLVKNKLKPENMVTSLNREIYEVLYNALEAEKYLDISLFGSRFTPEQIGYIVSLQNGNAAGNNPDQVINDCVQVILNESALSDNSNIADLSIDDWTSKIKNIANNKKGD